MAARKKAGTHDSGADKARQAMRDSAQKIWLAGLGAFERAKSEGPKMFETLVEQGRTLGDQALRAMRETSEGASGRWDKLEQVFEDRVAKSLNRLGVLTSRELDDLSRQVQELNDNVRDMMRNRAAGGAPRKPKKAAGKSKPRAKKPAGRASRASRARRA
jgi:poly(hydroxyalkanoate) granule-associated protein